MLAVAAPYVAVVILHWGAVEVTARCLQSIARAAFPGRRTILVIDNTGRMDPARLASAALPELEVYRSPRNLGFAGGCAWGMAMAMEHGVDFVLLLNNDAVVEPSFLDILLRALAQSPGVGVLCPQVVSPRGLWYVGGTFSLWSGIPLQQRRSRDSAPISGRPREVDYATGCAMLVDPAVVRAAGSFDPQFFMYCEDLDFSLRVRQAGFKILFVPASLVHHVVTDESDREALRIYYSTRNLLEVMRRHAAWYQWPGFVVNFLVRWLGFFMVLACLRRRPRIIGGLVTGTIDFLRRRFGER